MIYRLSIDAGDESIDGRTESRSPESIDNLSTKPRNLSTGKWLKPEKRLIIDRQIPRIDRFSEVEPRPVAPHKSSDNLPRIGQNLPTANRQVIVRCTFRIVRSSIPTRNPSTANRRPPVHPDGGSIHRQSADLSALLHRSARQPTAQASFCNRQMKLRNRPIIVRQIRRIVRFLNRPVTTALTMTTIVSMITSGMMTMIANTTMTTMTTSTTTPSSTAAPAACGGSNITGNTADRCQVSRLSTIAFPGVTT